MTELETLMNERQYSPYLIFNFDETMLQPGTPKVKALIRSSGKTPPLEVLEKQEHITLGVCVSAAGAALPVLVILPLKTLPNMPERLLKLYLFTGQQTGWMTKEIWKEYIKNVFIPYLQEVRSTYQLNTARGLLIVDSHSSHEEEEAIELLHQNNIDVVVIPAHSSSILRFIIGRRLKAGDTI